MKSLTRFIMASRLSIVIVVGLLMVANIYTITAANTTYLGCFFDYSPDPVPGPTRATVLPLGMIRSSDMTIGLCINHCLDLGNTASMIRYAGLETGNECWCGEENAQYWRYGQKPEEACSRMCAGDSNQTCGDEFHIQVYDLSLLRCELPLYRTGLATSDSANSFVQVRMSATFSCDREYEFIDLRPLQCIVGNSNVTEWDKPLPKCQEASYIGCFYDYYPEPTRVLPLGGIETKDLTIGLCINHCLDLGNTSSMIRYVGLEAGNECWCGEEDAQYWQNGQRHDEACSTPCAGDINQTCGADFHIKVYDLLNGSTGKPTTKSITVLNGSTGKPTTKSISVQNGSTGKPTATKSITVQNGSTGKPTATKSITGIIVGVAVGAGLLLLIILVLLLYVYKTRKSSPTDVPAVVIDIPSPSSQIEERIVIDRNSTTDSDADSDADSLHHEYIEADLKRSDQTLSTVPTPPDVKGIDNVHGMYLNVT